MEEGKAYHMIFNWKEIYISETLSETVVFLWDIEKEIKQFLSYPSKISSIGDKLSTILDDLKWLSQLVQHNNIKYQYNITQETIKIVDEIETIQIPRSQIICLFAYMETIFCLLTVFNNKLDDDNAIIFQSNRELKKYINKYILTEKNGFYKENKSKLQHLQAQDILDIRNGLTHFYSVSDKIGIVQDSDMDDTKELEKALDDVWKKYIFLCPNDILELIRNSIINIFIEWSDMTYNRPSEFKENFIFVEKIVKRKSAKILRKEWKIQL